MAEQKKRGRPKKSETPLAIKDVPLAVEEPPKAPVKLPIKYVGSVALRPDDPRFADGEIGSFVYDTKTKEAVIDTSSFPPAWKEFEAIFGVGVYKIIDSKTGTEFKLVKAEDPDKWIEYIQEAEFLTTRGIYHIVGITKVYEAQ